jgi:hypothetical protein
MNPATSGVTAGVEDRFQRVFKNPVKKDLYIHIRKVIT